MALNIKNPETERLARELARRRKQGITTAITEVLRQEVERERKKPRRDDIEQRLLRGVSYKQRSAAWLLERGDWDLAVVGFCETHPAGHYLWPAGVDSVAAGDPAAVVYGSNYARLRDLKTKYDPENFFRLNNNIVPAK